MDVDEDRIDQAVLALMYLTLHDGYRAWKGFDWDVLDRLHERYDRRPQKQGEVEITAGADRPVHLREGDAIVFEADVTHSYRNLAPAEAVLYLVMTYAEGVG